MSQEQDEIEASLLEYSYAQAPLTLAGSAASALVMAAFVARHGWVTALAPWLGAHLVISVLGYAGMREYKRSGLSDAARAKRVRLGGILSLAVVWASASMLWPLSAGETGVGVLLCISGLAAAATSTSAADPTGAIVFNVLAFVPHLASQSAKHPWLSILITLYIGAVTVLALRNHRLLVTSLALRFSNTQLIAEARAERVVALAEKRRAEEAAAARTRFLAMASHDLRQPVQALALFADVLARGPSEPERADVVSSLSRSTQALSSLLDSLLDISRLDAGVAVPAPSSVPIMPILEDIALSLALDAEERGMVVSVRGRDGNVWADRTMLARVLQNLAVNAVRHGAGRVLLSSRTRGHACLVQVWDQGSGIAEADRERIFDELVQLDRTHPDRGKGLGLGLSMVKRLCSLNGWSLTLHSRPGRGTVFSVELPRATRELAVTARTPSHGHVASVLYVEDDREVREATSAWLRSRNVSVFVATQASEARELWQALNDQQQRPELLITDFGLPGSLTGVDLAHALREQDPQLAVVVVTAAQTLPFADTPLRGAIALQKPVKGEELWQAMQDARAALAET